MNAITAPTESPPVSPALDERRPAAHTLVTQLLSHMALSFRVESKDAEDGGILVALHPEPADAEQAGFAVGRRSPALEALQFFVNKVVNPPTVQRRWVGLAVGDFPAPRGAPQPSVPPAPRAAVPAPASAPAPAPRGAGRPVGRVDGARGAAGTLPPPARGGSAPSPLAAEETADAAPPDPLMASAGEALATRSAALGRFYAVLALSAQDRARLMQAARGVEGVTVVSEGEGRNRRLVYRPAKPAPLAKRVPDDDDEE